MSARTQLRATVVAMVLVGPVVGLVPANAFASRAVPPVPDPERNSRVTTGTMVGLGKTQAEVTSAIGERGMRLTDLEVASTSPLRFDFTAVTNWSPSAYADPYQRDWWWFSSITAADLATEVTTLDARIIDLQGYGSGPQRRYAAILVSNKDEAAKSWWWYLDRTPAQLNALQAQNGARIVDLTDAGSGLYDVVMIANSGVDSTNTKLFLDQSESDIRAALSSQSLRPIDAEPQSDGDYDVVAVTQGPEQWSWRTGLSTDQLSSLANEPDARVYDLAEMQGAWSALVMNPPPDQPSAETARLQALLEAGGGTGSYGFRVGEPGQPPIAALHANAIFDPASAIKFLLLVYAMRQVELGNASLSEQIPLAPYPACGGGALVTLGKALHDMMFVSDNPSAHAVVFRFGLANIDAFANSLGFTDTATRACGLGIRAYWTLDDAAGLYGDVAAQEIVQSPSILQSLWDHMLGGNDHYYDPVINDVAAKVGVSGQRLNAFKNKVINHDKGGSLGLCRPAPADCSNAYSASQTGLGLAEVPFATIVQGHTIVDRRPFTYGLFVDPITIPCSFQGADETLDHYFDRCPAYKQLEDAIQNTNREMLRVPLEQALQTWKQVPLKVSRQGTGHGIVTSSPPGIHCGASCSHAYADETLVKLSPKPSNASTFAGWQGGGCAGSRICTVRMNADQHVTAVFEAKRTLSVTKSGAGKGTVRSVPSGIACGATCAHQFADGTKVSLSSSPVKGSRFIGWSGACSGTGPCKIAMNADKSVGARFQRRP